MPDTQTISYEWHDGIRWLMCCRGPDGCGLTLHPDDTDRHQAHHDHLAELEALARSDGHRAGGKVFH